MARVWMIDQGPFVVGLPEVQQQPVRFARRAAQLADIIQRLRAVYAGLALAQQVQIRAVQHQYRFHRGPLMP